MSAYEIESRMKPNFLQVRGNMGFLVSASWTSQHARAHRIAGLLGIGRHCPWPLPRLPFLEVVGLCLNAMVYNPLTQSKHLSLLLTGAFIQRMIREPTIG
eukprot:g56062.t1